MSKIAGLLLAAGASTRMEKPKQLLRVRGETLLDRALRQSLSSDLDLVVLVLGHESQQIQNSLKTDLSHPKLRIIRNEHYLEGISSSIAAGLSEVEESHDHIMIILADMPYVSSHVINLLMDRYLESGLPLGAVKTLRGRSHPVIISRRYYKDVRCLEGDVGARDLFKRHPAQVCLMEIDEEYDDRDIDTTEDYQDLIESLLKK